MSKLPFKEFFKNKTNKIQGYIPGHLNSEVHEVGMNGRGNWQSWISLSLRPHSERRKWKKKKKKSTVWKVVEHRGLWKGYKNKSREIEELFSVYSGKVCPNDKLSRGNSSTTERLFP